MAPKATELETYRTDCWNGALHTYGTSAVFQRRAIGLRQKLRILNYIGIAVPLLVGGLVVSYGAVKILPIIIGVASAIGLVQLAVNAWAMTAGWVEAYSYAVGSVTENDSLANRYQDLAKNPPLLDEMRQRYDKLQHEDGVRRSRDNEQGVTAAEKRYGMRAALRKYQRKCSACTQVPTTMKPGNCGVCGDYKFSEK